MKTLLKPALDLFVGSVLLFVTTAAASPAPMRQAGNPNPPDRVVRLIFIHHSTGENWLRDGYGGLGLALSRNNYFVSDTNYGWGPDAIGDRTDIPNWIEWFASGRTATYMNALFNESGQNSGYTRTLSDPGGENEIVMFKSCFPNSNLEGSPNDPPGEYADMTVSGAKYVYNTILRYFATRPDKLFVVITAPPVSDPTFAENARAFNSWLVNDWLRENNYTLNNVAVFDFYNVLTGPNTHHRFHNGQIEHTYGTRHTLYYPSEDDHPSAQGSRKATEEFVPLLNVFYHRWQSGAPLAPPAQVPSEPPAGEVAESPPIAPPPAGTLGLLDDFEGAPPAGTSGWEGYFQDNTDTRLSCARETGAAHGRTASLRFDFDVTANSWATCGFYFGSLQNWSAGNGISFYLKADRAGIPFDVNLYGGTPGGRTTYILRTETPPGSKNEWSLFEIRWADILRADWEENSGAPFDPAAVTGFSIGLSTPETERIAGTIWLDDLGLLGAPASAPVESPTELPRPSGEAPVAVPALPCLNALLLPLLLAGLALIWGEVSQPACRLAFLLAAAFLAACNLPPADEAASPPVTAPGAVTASIPLPPPSGDAVTPADFEYLGAFRLPGGDEPPRTFAYGGNAMTFNPDGNPAGAQDGFPGSLLVMGHDRVAYGSVPDGGQVAEVNIPAPILSRHVETLNTAEFLQDFANLFENRFIEFQEIPKAGMQYLNRPETGPKIHVAWGEHLQRDEFPSHGWFSPTLSAPDFQGEWFIGNVNMYSVNAYLFEIPAAWADRYAGGRFIASGRMRDGGQGGMGPALFAYRPWNEDGSPPPSGTRLEEVALLLYENAYNTEDIVRAMNGYQHPDAWEGGAWLTTPSGKQAVLFAGTKSSGAKYWYGFIDARGPQYACVDAHVTDFPTCRMADGSLCPQADFAGCCNEEEGTCASGRGWWSTRFDAQFILFDPNDLAKVASGQMESWEPQPYAVLDIDERLYLKPPEWDIVTLGWGDQRRDRIGDVAYDRANGLLYVLELYADGAKPVVHVWRIR